MLGYSPAVRTAGPVDTVGRRRRSASSCWRCSARRSSNVARHARATRVEVEVAVDVEDRSRLTVLDDGIGLPGRCASTAACATLGEPRGHCWWRRWS